jgi:hypothetical protein
MAQECSFGHVSVRPVSRNARFGTAAPGAKLPFVGMSAHGGKADFPVARPDF